MARWARRVLGGRCRAESHGSGEERHKDEPRGRGSRWPIRRIDCASQLARRSVPGRCAAFDRRRTPRRPRRTSSARQRVRQPHEPRSCHIAALRCSHPHDPRRNTSATAGSSQATPLGRRANACLAAQVPGHSGSLQQERCELSRPAATRLRIDLVPPLLETHSKTRFEIVTKCSLITSPPSYELTARDELVAVVEYCELRWSTGRRIVRRRSDERSRTANIWIANLPRSDRPAKFPSTLWTRPAAQSATPKQLRSCSRPLRSDRRMVLKSR